MTVTQADRLANDPARLKSREGAVLELDFGFGAHRRIEKDFGSVLDLATSLTVPTGPRYYEAVEVGVAAGAWRAKKSVEDVVTFLGDCDPDEVQDVLIEAITKSLPKLARQLMQAARAEAAKIDLTDEIEKAKAAGLSGTSATTSPLLSAVGPLKSSGA